MLHDPTRHEALQAIAWDEQRVRDTIGCIVADTEAHFSPGRYWPLHPRDVEPGDDPNQPCTNLSYGACGVIWALEHLQAVGAARLSRSCVNDASALETLLADNRAFLQTLGSQDYASYLNGDTPILLLGFGHDPTPERADGLAVLIAGNQNHPARELMFGAPGTLLAALFLHQHTADARWATLFRSTAATLWSQLEWSAEQQCHYGVQDLFGRRTSYLDAMHGFVATAVPLIHGRHLLDAPTWDAWQRCITNSITRTALHEGAGANWPEFVEAPAGYRAKKLMQFCHGAPGFVVCLADMPRDTTIAADTPDPMDTLLVAAGEAIWAAGPLNKGSNLCHGTGGNGYAFLKLYRRTGDPLWLQRARAFAMHAIAQTAAEALRYGQMRYSLWTGDLGLAIYLWDCLRGVGEFPTLDVFWSATEPERAALDVRAA